MNVYYEKTADLIEMPFGEVGWVGPKNHIVEAQMPARQGANFCGG